MDNVKILMWVATTIAIVGSLLNARQIRAGFYVWLVSNVMYVVINIMLHAEAQAALFVFNSGVCLYGLWQWKNNKNGDNVQIDDKEEKK